MKDWRITRFLVLAHAALVFWAWILFAIVVTLIVAGIAIFGTIEMSIWDEAVRQVPRWFALGVFIYLMTVMLPLHVAYGESRRNVLRQGMVFAVLFSVALAGLVAVGYGIEALVYGAADWPQTVRGGQSMYSSVGQVPLILLAYTMNFLTWTGAGAFIGAAFYRFQGGGALTIPVGLLLITPGAIAVGGAGVPFLAGRLPDGGVAVPITVACCLLSFLVSWSLAWRIARDVPIRTRAA
jgi:hypothetical protein